MQWQPSGIKTKLIVCALLLTSLQACDSLPGWMKGETKKEVLPGDRIAILKQDEALSADASLSSTPMVLPDAEPRENWPAHSGNVDALLGHISFIDMPTKQDKTSIGDGAAFEHGEAVKPVVFADVVYAMDAKGMISAQQSSNISNTLWKNNGVANAEETVMLAGGMAYGDGKLFAVSGNGLIAAFDAASGRELWRQEMNIPVRSAPLVTNGKVFVVTIDSQTFSYDAATGSPLWTDRGVSEGASFVANASPSYANGLIVIPYASSELRTLTADDGQQIWADVLAMARRNSATSEFSGMGGDPVILGNALYAVSTSGVLSAYRLDNGLRVWEQPVSSVNTPLVVGNVVYVLSSESTLMALNRIDGRIYWLTPLPRFADEKKQEDAFSWYGPVLAGGKLYIVGAHGEMRRFDPMTGAAIDTISVPEHIVTPPVIVNNRMFMTTQDAKLVSLY